MSNFLLGVVGAAIGSAFGMPALGFALGSGVGSALGHHHSAPPAIPGQRLQDLKVQTATYGIGIPQVYGRYRLGGNLIWSKDIVEVKGPNNQYLYYGNFALGLCKGPIAGIRRLWADGKEIFNDPYFLGEGIRTQYPPGIRFYPGDEAQLPDPLIEAAQGKGQVPAFRGLAYLVFENLPLAAYNNRLPLLQVEVVQAIEERPPSREEALPKTHREEERVVQKHRHYYMKREETQPALAPGTRVKVPAPLPVATVVSDLCEQVGFTPEQIDTDLLISSLLGFVVMPTSAREALAGLMQIYGFELVENGSGLVCIPHGQGAVLSVSEHDLAHEESAEAASALFTRLPALECPHQVVGVFNEPQQYRLITQTAEHFGGQRSERVELPLVLSPEEAARQVKSILEEAWANRLQCRFSLPRAYALLTPGDRVQWQDHFLQVLRVAYGSPGLVHIEARVESVVEKNPALEKGEERGN